MKITSDTHPNHVRSGVLDAIQEAPVYGLVLLITWSAYCELPYFHRRRDWQVIIDEVPQVDRFRESSLPRNSEFILDRVRVRPSGYDGLYRASAAKPRELEKLLQSDKDDVDEIFRDLYSCILSRNHEVFIDSESWDALVADTAGNGDGRLYILTMLNRRVFEEAILMGANIEHSLLFSWLKLRHNVRFTKGGYFQERLRFTQHELGSRVALKYFLEDNPYSKYFKNKTIADGRKAIELMDDAALEFFGDRRFLYIENNGDNSPLQQAKQAEKVPVMCHGLNMYDEFTGIYLSAALNRAPKHCQMMNVLGLTSDMLTRATAHETYYQAIMRTSLRRPEATEAVDIIVPDKSAADRVGELLGATNISQIPLPEFRAKPKLTQTQKNQRAKAFEIYEEILAPGQVPNSYILKGKSTVFGKGNHKVFVTLHKLTNAYRADEFVPYEGRIQQFIGTLRTFHRAPMDSKEEVPLFNPAVFEPQASEGSLRQGANFVRSSFLVLDFDDGQLSPEKFIELFGSKSVPEKRLSFVICNTFSRSADQPNRFRVIVLYQYPAESIKEHQAAYDYIEYKLDTAGWPPAMSGLDKVSRTGVQSFYLPCTNRMEPDWAMFQVHNTKSEEIRSYGLIPALIPQVAVHSGFVGDSLAEYGDIPHHLIEEAVAPVKGMTSGRHTEFFRTGIRLARLRHDGLRLSPSNIESILIQTAGTERHMKKKVKGVMRSLSGDGWFGPN